MVHILDAIEARNLEGSIGKTNFVSQCHDVQRRTGAIGHFFWLVAGLYFYYSSLFLPLLD